MGAVPPQKLYKRDGTRIFYSHYFRAMSSGKETDTPLGSERPLLISRLRQNHRDLKNIIEAVKALGVLALIALLIISVVLTTTVSRTEPRGDSKFLDEWGNNVSLCPHNDQLQYDLPQEYRITVCNNGIDIRRFINHKPSDRAIRLDFGQWSYLLRITSYINRDIKNITTR